MSTESTALVAADNERIQLAMNQAYWSILQIINVTFGEGLNNAKIAEHVVRSIANGEVANVRMEW